MTRPLLWFIAGALCAHLAASRRHAHARAALTRRLHQAEHERDLLATAYRDVQEVACALQQERDQAVKQVVLERGRALMLVRDKFGTAALYDH